MTRAPMEWRRAGDYYLHGDGFTICLARVGDRVAYSLWREARARFSSSDLLRTITGVDPDDTAARIAAVNELKLEAERHERT